jgi:pyrimidine operon attenuation protein/uracil phosphoribosyltransferase
LEAHEKLIYDNTAIALAIDTVLDAIMTEFRNTPLDDVALVGIQSKGVVMALRLREAIKKASGKELDFATLDINMYRDDIGKRKKLPVIHETNIPFDLDNKKVILVDDVLHTGRTIRAALDAITDYGRPALIRLAVMIDRGKREFPIRADYIGLNIEIPEGRNVKIYFDDEPSSDAIYEISK